MCMKKRRDKRIVKRRKVAWKSAIKEPIQLIRRQSGSIIRIFRILLTMRIGDDKLFSSVFDYFAFLDIVNVYNGKNKHVKIS